MNWLKNLMVLLSTNRPSEKVKEIVETLTSPARLKQKEFPCKDCIVAPAKCQELCDKVEMDNKNLMALFLKYNACPDCGSEKFYEGPSGGMSQNVTCAGCEHKFNLALPAFVERI